MWIMGLPACIVHMYVGRGGSCIVQRWVYLWLQPLCMATLLGWDIGGSNIPGWYYSTLVIIWAVYSRIDVKFWIGSYPFQWIF